MGKGLRADLGDPHRQEHDHSHAHPGDYKTDDGFFVRLSDFQIKHNNLSFSFHSARYLLQNHIDTGFSQLVFLSNGCVEDGVESIQSVLVWLWGQKADDDHRSEPTQDVEHVLVRQLPPPYAA